MKNVYTRKHFSRMPTAHLPKFLHREGQGWGPIQRAAQPGTKTKPGAMFV